MKTNKKIQTNKFEHESKSGCYAFIRPSVRQFKRHSCISNERKSFLALHKQYRLTLFWKRAGGGGVGGGQGAFPHTEQSKTNV